MLELVLEVWEGGEVVRGGEAEGFVGGPEVEGYAFGDVVDGEGGWVGVLEGEE